MDGEGTIYISFQSGFVGKIPREGGNFESIANVTLGLSALNHLIYSRADSALYATALQGHTVFKVTLDGQVNVLAGTGFPGTVDGPGPPLDLASFTNPNGIAVSEDGNTIYVNHIISGETVFVNGQDRFAANPNSIRVISNVLSTSLVANEDDAEVPEGFMLAQNYPNPFNPSTSIHFTLSQPQAVTLTVYDLLGREVATLVDGLKQAGAHEATFDACGLTSGAYVYRLETERFSRAKMMTLLK